MMPEAFPSKRPTLLPLLCYRDPERAIEWLRKSFGLETQCVAKRVDGGFAYAHLGSGDELIMVSPAPAPDAKTDSLVKAAPDAKAPQQACYFVVADIDAHFKRAKDAGAAIELEIKDYEHGGRRYSCRDLEGHVWTFGTYDPWTGNSATTDTAAQDASKDAADKKPLAKDRAPVAVARPRLSTLQSRLARRTGLIAAGALSLAAVGVTAWQLRTDSQATLDAATSQAAAMETELRRTESEFAVAQQELAKTREELAQERTAREVLETSRRAVQAELATERNGREQAERSAQALKAAAPVQDNTATEELAQARTALVEERKARESLEAAQREATAELERERSARQEAERAATAVKAELASAQSARTAAEKTASALDAQIKDEQMKRDELAAQAAASAAKAPEPAPAPAPVAVSSSSMAGGFVTTTTRTEPHVAVAAIAKPAVAVAGAHQRAHAKSHNPKLAAGEAALAKGDLEAARRYFKELADAGLPEGALALGSTYDPKSLERAGLAGAQADRARAKEWYRRAIELAQTERQTPK